MNLPSKIIADVFIRMLVWIKWALFAITFYTNITIGPNVKFSSSVKLIRALRASRALRLVKACPVKENFLCHSHQRRFDVTLL